MPEDKKPRFSIIVPALNEETIIAECLDSINNQTFGGNYEIIVADGNSKDKTVEISKKLADKVIIEKRRSGSFERNAGAKAADGEILVFTDADSVVPNDWLEKINETFEKNRGIDYCFGSVFYSDTSGLEKKISEAMVPLYMGFFNLIGMNASMGANMAIRKITFDYLGGFNTKLYTCEDLDLVKRLRQNNKKGFYNPKIYLRVSGRRVKEWGYVKFITFHMWNLLKFELTGKAEENYEPVR